MQIAYAMPTEFDFFSDNVNYRSVYKNLFSRIDNTGVLTTEKLDRLLAEEEDELGEEYSYLCDEHERQGLVSLYNEWLDTFVTEWENVHEIKSYTLPKEVFGTNSKGLAFKLRNTIGLHIFYELSRLKCLISYKELMREKRLILGIGGRSLRMDERKRYKTVFSLAVTQHPMWGEITQFIENVIQNLIEEQKRRQDKVSGYIDPYLIALRKRKKVRSEEQREDAEEIEEMQNLLQQMQSLFEKPVFQYKQTEIIMALKFLTYYVNEIPTEDTIVIDYEVDADVETSVSVSAIEETRMFFEALFMRNSLFFCEVMTDQELDNEDMRSHVNIQDDCNDDDDDDEAVHYYQPNRLYCAFCSFYMGSVLRRFYYYDHLKENQMDPIVDLGLLTEEIEQATQRTETWLKDIASKMPEESILDMYAEVCEEAYQFPGDERYFGFKYPRKIKSTNAFLQWMRPALSKQFHSEGNVSLSSIFSSVHRSHVSRCFILHLLHSYLKIQRSIKWMHAVLVDNEGIELSRHRLMANRAPLLVQPMGRYWPYDQGKIYRCDSIYKSIALWFWLLQERYNSQLYGIGLHPFIKAIWPQNRVQRAVQNNQVVDLI